MEADLDTGLPIQRAEVMVEYGAVDIGGKTYFCPVRSVSLSRGRTVNAFHDEDDNSRTWGPSVTMLNDVVFGEYHVFRAEMRVISGDIPEQE